MYRNWQILFIDLLQQMLSTFTEKYLNGVRLASLILWLVDLFIAD